MCFIGTLARQCKVCGFEMGHVQKEVFCREAQLEKLAFGKCSVGRQPDKHKDLTGECNACKRKREDKEDRTTMEESHKKHLRDLHYDRDEEYDGYYTW